MNDIFMLKIIFRANHAKDSGHPLTGVKVSSVYNPYLGECLLERIFVLGHQLYEVEWPVPVLVTFISLMFLSGLHSINIKCKCMLVLWSYLKLEILAPLSA